MASHKGLVHEVCEHLRQGPGIKTPGLISWVMQDHSDQWPQLLSALPGTPSSLSSDEDPRSFIGFSFKNKPQVTSK